LLPVSKEIFTDIDKDTSDWQVKLFLGAIALNEKNDNEAEKYFAGSIELAQYNPEGWIRLGALYFDNRRYTEAVKLLSEAVEIYPQDFGINLLLGLSYAQSDKHTEAEPFLKTAVEINRNEVTALSAYAYTLSQLKQDEAAISYLNKALAIAPDDVNLLGTLGLIYNSLEMWEECDSTYEKALSIDSLNPLVNNNYAYSLAERDLQLERALSMVKISIEAEPYNSSYLDTIGWVYFKLKQYDEAEDYIRKALDVAGESAVLLDHLGDVLFMKGDRSGAMEMWEKAFAINSTDEKIKLKIEKGEI
jgi:tetratricopeptide (TPR) repeat protein